MAAILKFEHWRSRDWLDWVKSLPSAQSGRPADDPHHIKGYSHITGSSGGQKGDDLFVIPLTRDEHTAFDHIGWKSWEQLHGSQLEHWARMMRLAFKLGKLTLSK
jgi:hypothetical protein